MSSDSTTGSDGHTATTRATIMAEKKVNVLVVDDRREQRLAMSVVLEELDVNIIEAGSGSEALRVLSAQSAAVVLMDVRMPGIDGFETAGLIRQRISEHLPIIFVTGYGPEEIDQSAGYALGAVDFIFRPVQPVALRAKVGVFVELYRRSEQARLQAEQTIRQARAAFEARTASRMKDEFLATLSHELRTPLTAMTGWIHLLRAPTIDAATRERGLKIIEKNVNVQKRLIEDLLDVSRIVAGKLEIKKDYVNFPEVVKAAIQTLQPAAALKSISLNMQVDVSDTVVLGDPVRLQQIVSNLISNAIKFTNHGGSVEALLRQEGRSLTLAIVDNGIGIEPSSISGLFKKFVQADDTSAERGGLGLGLAIVRHLVELHGGSVSAESAGKGKGSSFQVVLPVSDEQRPSNPTKRKNATAAPLSNVNVLLVEDNDDTRELMTFALESLGCKVTSAESGPRALEQMRTLLPQVLISDIGMPEMSGYELIQYVRAEISSKLPAIALTAYASAQDWNRAMAAGFDLHLPKPVEPGELREAIVSLCSKKQMAAK